MINKYEAGGVIALYKPEGMTSFDVVSRVRRLYSTKKVGHTGTLDPMARGVLILLVGRAVKASELLVCDDKSYLAGLTLGLTTDSEDITGNLLSKCDSLPTAEQVKEVCSEFLGEIEQIPPMYSALKVNGQKLCDLARRGVEVERQARKINIYSLSVSEESEKEGKYLLDISCSKGTYVRTLCADIGKRLGCGGVMNSLERTGAGGFTLDDCLTLEELENMDIEERYQRLILVDSLFEDAKRVELAPFFERLARSGNPIYLKKIGVSLEEGNRARLYGKDGFFALGQVKSYPEGLAIKPIKQFDI